MSTIYFEEHGQGAAVILLHGFCENRLIWKQFAATLGKEFRIITPDLPGFGNSPLPTTPFSLVDIAHQMLDWITEHSIQTPVVIGHSLGGYVTLAMADLSPDLFPGIGLFHSTAYADSPERKENRNKVIDFVSRNGAAPFIETFVPGLFHQKNNSAIPVVHEIAAQTRKETIMAYAAAMRDRAERIDLLENFQRPILTIAGEEDATIPFQKSFEQAQTMKNPFFTALKNTGHMGMFESELESLHAVKSFVEKALKF